MTEHILTAHEQFAEAVGADYGPASDKVQSALLNGFTHGLTVACSYKPETQIAYMVDGLTDEASRTIKAIADMIDAKAQA